MLVVAGRKFPERLMKRMSMFMPGKVEWRFTDHEEFKDIEDADVIFTYKLSPKDLERAKKVKWIQISSSGYEHLPMQELRKRNIIVTNINGVAEKMVAQHVVLSMLYFARDMSGNLQNMTAGKWEKINGFSLTGKKVLILGTGKIGTEVARVLSVFDMDTYGVNRSGKHTGCFKKIHCINELLNLLPDMDFIVNALPLTDETAGIIDSAAIKSMKPSAYFILVGRAHTVEEKAFFHALLNKKIAGAAIDVFWEEPLPNGSPWYTLDNVLLTPHTSGVGKDYDDKITDIFLDNLKNFVEGRQLKYLI